MTTAATEVKPPLLLASGKPKWRLEKRGRQHGIYATLKPLVVSRGVVRLLGLPQSDLFVDRSDRLESGERFSESLASFFGGVSLPASFKDSSLIPWMPTATPSCDHSSDIGSTLSVRFSPVIGAGASPRVMSVAARVLVEGGLLVALCGQYWLHEVSVIDPASRRIGTTPSNTSQLRLHRDLHDPRILAWPRLLVL